MSDIPTTPTPTDTRAGIFIDAAGGTSSMRVVFVSASAIAVAAWIVACVLKRELVDFPPGMTTLVLGLGAVKCTQRFGEK